MALTIPCNTGRIIELEDYLERIGRDVDVSSIESIAASAELLRGLANDRTLVVNKLNEAVESAFSNSQVTSAQSLILGRGNGFYVRANIWPATSDMANGRAYQNQFSYNLAHDHNFTFMTVNYLGTGYQTEIYEYEYSKVAGYVGEPVDLMFLEKTKFSSGAAMLYRAGRDVHIQFAPEELTVTLNLMIEDEGQQFREQYYFDVVKRVITGYPEELLATRRASLVALAGYVGNDNTNQLLRDLAVHHPCRRTRLTAIESLAYRMPSEAARIWEIGTRDPSGLVTDVALRKLAELEKH